MKLRTLLLGLATAMIAAPGAQAADWTGFYIGGQVGGAWSDGTLNFIGAFPPVPAPVNNMSDSGFVGGVRVGYDHQINQWVLGAVADINATDLSDTNLIPFGPATTNSYDVNFTGSVRGRVGYLANEYVLGYVTAGWAFADVDYTNQFGASPTQTIGDTMSGYIVGAGVEWAATEMFSAFAEYTYSDFGSNTTAAAAPFAGHRFDLDIHQIVVGVAYRFN